MSTKRRSLRDRETQAITGKLTHPDPTTAAGATTRLGTYWQLGTFETAKSAYLVDLDTAPEAPSGFAHWINRVIDKHARLSPQRRAKLAHTLGPEPKDGTGVSRSFTVTQATVAAMEAAIVADRKTLARMISRTEFVAEAVRAAITETRKRYGSHQLPPAPARLPNKPPRG